MSYALRRWLERVGVIALAVVVLVGLVLVSIGTAQSVYRGGGAPNTRAWVSHDGAPPATPACTTCRDGKDGRDGRDGVDGRDGADGRDGRDGVDAINFVCPARRWREFDLGSHALPLPVMAVVTNRFCERRVIGYTPDAMGLGPVAVLVNPDTGMGQVAMGFTAGLAPDDRGPITFETVTALDGWSWLLWSHRGGHWLSAWPLGLPELDLRSVVFPNPRTGQPEALFRWRE